MMGSKAAIASWIVDHFPKHRVYCEPFGGTMSVLLAKPVSDVEIYNDINSNLVNFFTTLRDVPFDLIGRLAFTPAARSMYEDVLAKWREGKLSPDPVTRAYEWFILASQSFSGHLGTGWAHSRQGQSAAQRWVNAVNRLYDVTTRIQQVQIESRPYQDILKAYDGLDTLFYVDPPYVMATEPYPEAPKWDWPNFVGMVRLLQTVKGKVALSSYPNQFVDELLHKWRWDSIGAVKSSEGVTEVHKIGKRQPATELLLMNY